MYTQSGTNGKSDRRSIRIADVWRITSLHIWATSGILNDLYPDQPVDETRHQRLLCLFRLEFAQPLDMRSEVAGRPVYMAMAQDSNGLLKLKPQNLLLNLPLARRS